MKKPKDMSKKHEYMESKAEEAKETRLEKKGYVETKSGKMKKVQKAYIGRAVRQPTETDTEFQIRHEYHTPFEGPQKAQIGKLISGDMGKLQELKQKVKDYSAFKKVKKIQEQDKEQFFKEIDKQREQENFERFKEDLYGVEVKKGGLIKGPQKASLGALIGIGADNLLKKSETARSLTKNLGIGGNLLGSYYDKKADTKDKTTGAQQTQQVTAKRMGGMVEIGKGKDYIKDLL